MSYRQISTFVPPVEWVQPSPQPVDGTRLNAERALRMLEEHRKTLRRAKVFLPGDSLDEAERCLRAILAT